MPTDSEQLRNSLAAIFPSLEIIGVAKASGQRVVYFGRFLASSEEGFEEWDAWGPVVVKVVEGITANSLTYLQREISILSELNSPDYPHLHFSDTFHDNPITEQRLPDRLFITIEEHVQSRPLTDCFAEYCGERTIVDLLIKLVSALKLLWNHKTKIVHRDIKPDNILIRPDGGVTIIDLGITRETGADGATQTFFAHGPMTLRYGSPEQARNDKRNITFKSDCFSLGIIAYELASGLNPFVPQGPHGAMDIYNNLLSLKARPLDEFNEVSERFARLIDRLLEKEPFRRFRTVDDLLLELNKIKEHHDAH